MNIIIAGAGEVGSHLAKMLGSENHNLTIIDSDEERLSAVSETVDATMILGSPTSIDILKKAHTEEADLFVAVFPAKFQDVNIIAAALAKKMGAKNVTSRINNEEYLESDNNNLFKEMGVDLLFYPEKIAATEITDLLKQAEMSEFVKFSHGRLQLLVFRLDEEAPLVDKSPADFNYPADNLPFRVVAISREDGTVIPNDDTKFKVHDQLYIIAKRDSVDEAMKYSGKKDFRIKRITILGGGRIGAMVAEKLENRADFVKIIEINRERCEYLSERLNKTLVINGDGRNSDFLYEEDVKSCDAFIAVTSSTETNILACVAAKKLGVPKTIAEVENLQYIKLAEGMGVDAIINKKLITAGRIFRFTLTRQVCTLKCLNGTNSEIIEFTAGPNSPITKGKLSEIDFPEDAIIGGAVRGPDAFITTGESIIKPFDRVTVFALPSALKKVEKFFL